MKYLKLYESKDIDRLNKLYKGKFIIIDHPVHNSYKGLIVLIDIINYQNNKYFTKGDCCGILHNDNDNVKYLGYYNYGKSLSEFYKIKPHTVYEFYDKKPDVCEKLCDLIYDQYKNLGEYSDWYKDIIIKFYNELKKLDYFKMLLKINNYNL